jgi:hypothetical protein
MKLTEQKLRQAVRQYVKHLIKEQTESVGGFSEMPTDDDQILSKFPKLKDALVSLMGRDYKAFIEDIKYVAPKPTTFQIDIGNEYFNLMWVGDKMGFVCEVQGKKYYIVYNSEKQQAIKAINRLFRLGATTPEEAKAEEEGVTPGEEVSTPPPPPEPEPGGVSPEELQ